MDLTSQLTAQIKQNRDLTINERAELACRLAKQFETAGEYEAVAESLHEFWRGVDETPNVIGLDEPTKAEVLLRCGAVVRDLGSSKQLQGSQETAKNLITEAIDILEKLGESVRAAEARSDLALCYWREGSYDEARILLEDALNSLGDQNTETRAILLVRAGIVALWSGRLNEALRLYERAAPILDTSQDHALKGRYHNELGLVLKELAVPENRQEYLDRALIEYAAASFHFEQAGNTRYQASVENNLGFIFFKLERFSDAHTHLDRAAYLFLHLGDQIRLAQVNETRARVFLAEGKAKDAEHVITSAVKTFAKGDEQALLAEALITYGTIRARLGNHYKSRQLLQRALEVAETCGDLEGAGRARLSIIEELSDQTPAKELATILHEAADLLKRSQDPSAGKRLVGCALKTIHALLGEIEKGISVPSREAWKGFSLKREIKKIERRFIERALRDAGGSVTKAAKMLGYNHHQSLILLLNTRHSDLRDRRSIRRRRRRPLLPAGAKGKKKAAALDRNAAKFSILHVEDHKPIARLVSDMLSPEGFHVDTRTSGVAAWEILKADAPYDALVVDNNLPGLSGLELVLRVRSMPHRRNLPIVMLSSDDCEKEAWRAGADAFLRKPKGVEQLASTIRRVINERGAKDESPKTNRSLRGALGKLK